MRTLTFRVEGVISVGLWTYIRTRAFSQGRGFGRSDFGIDTISTGDYVVRSGAVRQDAICFVWYFQAPFGCAPAE